MDEKSDQILDHIETQRNQLGANLSELETRVRRTADWRAQFDKNPMLLLGAALGGGLLLGAIVSGARSRSRGSYTSSRNFSSSSSSGMTRTSGPATAHQKQQASQTLDQIKAALIAFGTARAKEFLTQALPGFDRHLSDAERSGRQSFSSSEQYGSSGSGPYDQGPEYGSGSMGSGTYTGSGSSYGPGYGQQTSGSGQGANYGQNFGTDYGMHTAGQRTYTHDREQQYREREPNPNIGR